MHFAISSENVVFTKIYFKIAINDFQDQSFMFFYFSFHTFWKLE